MTAEIVKLSCEHYAIMRTLFDFCPAQMIGMIKSAKKAVENVVDAPAPSSLVQVSKTKRIAARTTHDDQECGWKCIDSKGFSSTRRMGTWREIWSLSGVYLVVSSPGHG